jgi:hypothetical protein
LAAPADLQIASRADEILDRKLLAERAREGLERLPDTYRDAFVLRDLEELSTDEVAELLGIESAAVRQRGHRARLMLRGYLSHLVGGGAVTPHLACRDGVELLMDYLEGVPSEADREAIEAHVAGCPRCVAFVESYRATPRILRSATAAELPEDLGASLRRFLAERQ